APSIGCWLLADALGLEEVRRALAEDCADEDVTTRLLGTAAHAPATARFVAEDRFVVAGLPIAELIFHELDPRACLESHTAEGDWTVPEATFATLGASGRAALAGERVALNFLQRLSAVATLTRRDVGAGPDREAGRAGRCGYHVPGRRRDHTGDRPRLRGGRGDAHLHRRAHAFRSGGCDEVRRHR